VSDTRSELASEYQILQFKTARSVPGTPKTHKHTSAHMSGCALLGTVAYLFTPHLIIRRNTIVADESYCGVRITLGGRD
jgi:hypothetical protein